MSVTALQQKTTENVETPSSNIQAELNEIGKRARAAAVLLARATTEQKTTALKKAAEAMRSQQEALLEANEKDIAFAREKGISDALIDRLLLNPERTQAMAEGLVSITELPDPIGSVIADWDRPNGLNIRRVRTPLGVIGVIYESRPNVTADAGGLCLYSGNAAILRGGSESFHTSSLITACLREGLDAAGLPADAVQTLQTRDRAAVGALLSLIDYVDVIVPRGGKSLIERVMTEAKMPVFAHLEGLCHVYVHEKADSSKAINIAVNAKMRRTSVCGSAETLLVDASVAQDMLPQIVAALQEKGCAIRGDAAVCAIIHDAQPAQESDWVTEYLDAIISVRVVSGIEEAVSHINTYGSGHTDSIVTEDAQAAEVFLNQVDSAIVIHNASTQYADGAEFGMGAEIGISTGRMHARGPVGAEQLTSFKYQVRGNGQVRP